MKAAVILFPGSNREGDVEDALEIVTGRRPATVWHRDSALPAADLIVVPGGFSYGDYLRAGAMAAHSPIMREVKAAADRGVPVLGICNGFQILTECGLLPGALLRNAHLKFVCRFVHLRVETSDSVFTRGYNAGDVIRVPVAHHDGNYTADPETLARLAGDGRIAFRYSGPDGDEAGDYNPNGSAGNIAGILNERRNVLGLMPHPENAVDPRLGPTDGRGMFEGLAAALA
ncbi:MAG: phosphoribosylformylglycinamidine synthase subunit PurQ [Alphaproteobacteria bacterium]